MAWEYLADQHTYRPTGGDPLSASDLRALRDSFFEERKAGTADLASRLASGDLTLGAWEVGMREHIKTTFVAEAAFGKGGRDQMTQADWGSVGRTLRDQYGFLHGFAEHIATGELSEAQISARASMYVDAASQAYERSRARAFGELDLPQYPGDGGTQCGSRCACAWEISETDDEWRATWTLGAADHCGDCVDNAAGFNPLIVPKDTSRMANGNGRAHAHV